MTDCIFRADPRGRTEVEHLPQKLQGTTFDLLEMLAIESNIELLVIPVDLLVSRSLEEWLPRQKYVKNCTEREDIAARLHVLRLRKLDDLRCDIAGGAASEEKILLEVDVACKTEIHDHRLKGTSPQHDIFRLEVPVHDPVTMDVPQSRKYPRCDRLHFFLRKMPTSFLDGLEKRLSGQQLQDNIDRVVRLKHSLQFEHVGVGFCVQLPENSQLVNQAFLATLGAI
jgi:hypothetical protein